MTSSQHTLGTGGGPLRVPQFDLTGSFPCCICKCCVQVLKVSLTSSFLLKKASCHGDGQHKHFHPSQLVPTTLEWEGEARRDCQLFKVLQPYWNQDSFMKTLNADWGNFTRSGRRNLLRVCCCCARQAGLKTSPPLHGASHLRRLAGSFLAPEFAERQAGVCAAAG